MDKNSKQLSFIPNTGTSVPYITLTSTKYYDSSEFSSIYCSNNCSINIHITPEKKKIDYENINIEEGTTEEEASISSQILFQSS